MNKEYLKLNLGCGSTSPDGWINIDCSPNVLLAKVPGYSFIKGILLKLKLISLDGFKAIWSPNVLYCNLAKNFPHFPQNSINIIYSSHFLEHISYESALKLLRKCFFTLRSNGILRIAVPDLYTEAKLYIAKIDKAFKEGYEEPIASEEFIRHMVSREKRHAHLWMYDFFSLSHMLKNSGFIDIQQMQFRKSKITDIDLIENREDSLFIECTKP